MGAESFFNAFGLCSRSFVKEEDFESGTREFLKHQAQSGVAYTEFRVSPFHHVSLGGKNIKNILAFIRNGIRQALADDGIHGRCIVDSARQYGVDHVMKNFEWLCDVYDQDSMVGFGIGGKESAGDLSLFEPVYAMASKCGIPLSVHVETKMNETLHNLEYAIGEPSIKRIGHGIGIERADVRVARDLVKNGKLVEVCLTSNIKLGLVDGVSKHPVWDLYEKGVPICVCTDDPAILMTNHREETRIFTITLGLDDEGVRRVGCLAMRHAFCGDSLKKMISESLGGDRSLIGPSPS
ncbi:MAG: hypothetical protein WC091_09575 [Sulfuricellaceae bacterium]